MDSFFSFVMSGTGCFSDGVLMGPETVGRDGPGRMPSLTVPVVWRWVMPAMSVSQMMEITVFVRSIPPATSPP